MATFVTSNTVYRKLVLITKYINKSMVEWKFHSP